MASDRLKVSSRPALSRAKMVLAFSGWMDGGDVSTGTVKRLIDQHGAKQIAHIEPEGFYIYNFPGAMEVTALFRPHVDIQNGLIKSFEPPHNVFFCNEPKNLVLFVGKEPNLNWRQFGECIFETASSIGVTMILFVGSFGGTVPHTREPRLYATVSDANLRPMMQKFGVQFTNYEGPGSFTSYLMTQADARGFEMASIVAEIPGYLQGTNPVSIEVVTRRLAGILELPIDLADLRGVSTEWESRVSAEVEKNPDLAKQVRELEEKYDDDLIDKKPEEQKENADEETEES